MLWLSSRLYLKQSGKPTHTHNNVHFKKKQGCGVIAWSRKSHHICKATSECCSLCLDKSSTCAVPVGCVGCNSSIDYFWYRLSWQYFVRLIMKEVIRSTTGEQLHLQYTVQYIGGKAKASFKSGTHHLNTRWDLQRPGRRHLKTNNRRVWVFERQEVPRV